MTKHFCDKCGNELTGPVHGVVYFNDYNARKPMRLTLELCKKCTTVVSTFFKKES